MGRPRKGGNPLGLETRVYPHHGQFIYRHRDGSTELLGTDVDKANARARIYNDPEGSFGTVGHFLDLFIAEAKAGRLLKRRKPRTIEDYEEQAPFLKDKLGKLLPGHLVEHPEQLREYRDHRAAKVRANRELSLLSAMFTWLIQSGLAPGLRENPVALIERNPEKAKERYVEDHELAVALSIAVRPVYMAMRLAYVTLQRPADLLALSASTLKCKQVGGVSTEVLSVNQGKTGRTVNIVITDELREALYLITPPGEELGILRLTDTVTKIVPLVHQADGSGYTEDGLRAMLRRYCEKAGITPYGLMDVRAKGATDMYLRGVPLERIQLLMGHKSVTTTEIYIKRLLATVQVAQPNTQKSA